MATPRAVDVWKRLQIVERVKSDEGSTRRLMRGIITSGAVDSDGESLEQTSAYNGLVTWVKAGGTPIAYMHDPGGSLGHGVEVEGMQRGAPIDGVFPVWTPTTRLEDIDGSALTAEIGKGYGFGTILYGRVDVDDVWSMLEQKALGAWSIHIRGHEAGETDTGAPVIRTTRVIESSIVTVPAQADSAGAEVLQMLKSMGISTQCKACQTKAHEGIERLNNLAPGQWARAVAHLREHSQDDDAGHLRELARGYAGLAQALKGT